MHPTLSVFTKWKIEKITHILQQKTKKKAPNAYFLPAAAASRSAQVIIKFHIDPVLVSLFFCRL